MWLPGAGDCLNKGRMWSGREASRVADWAQWGCVTRAQRNSGSRPRSWQPDPLLGHPDSLCSGDLSPHTSPSPFPGLIPEEAPENSFLLEGDILRPVSEWV